MHVTVTSHYRAMQYSAKRAVLRLHVVRLSIRPSVTLVDQDHMPKLEILETNCKDN